jgi:hypothetical protein
MLLLSSTITAQVKIDGIYYNLSGRTAEVRSNPNGFYSGDVVIPSAVTYDGDNYTVTSIGDNAFAKCSGLTSIYIPNSIKNTGLNAFADCTSLTSVHITDIGAWCEIMFGYLGNPLHYAHRLYMNGKEINDIVIPNGVKEIGYSAFKGCTSLTSITIPNSVAKIHNYAFDGCTNLSSITVCAKEIGSEVFKNCKKLSSVILTNEVKVIGKSVFQYCTSLKSIVIPSSVTKIGKYLFENCPNLTSIVVESGNTIYDSRDNCNAIIETARNKIINGCAKSFIPSTVSSIDNCAFEYCRGLTSITIPSSVYNIGYGAFHGCGDLNNIVIQNGVKTIGYGAFEATSIESVIIPASVTTIEAYDYGNAFSNCPNLSSIVVEDGNMVYDSRNNCNAIIEKSSNTLISGCKKTIIPNSVTTIGSSAFYQCKTLYAINIPNSVSSILGNAFAYCSGLTSVTIPNSVTTIEEKAFFGAGLTSVIIGNGVKKIGSYAFYDCEHLRSIVSLIEDPFNIDYSCFACSEYYYDENLQDLVHNSEHEKLIYNNAKLIVPDGTIEKYKSTGAWKNFTNIIEQGQCSGVAQIGIVHLNGSDKVYTLDGIRLENIQKGLNIIRMKDGTTRKVVVK